MDFNDDFLSELNDAQRVAAETILGPVMIIAGAGSGKTRTLTYRIANILKQGYEPFRVMALTFTNKAAAEMKERIANLIGSKANHILMGTFHSVFAKILRVEAEKIGFTSNFTIYDSNESKSLIKKIVKGKNLDPKLYSENIVHNRISNAKNNLLAPEEYRNNPEIQDADRYQKRPLLGEIFTVYNAQMHRSNAMDFDDLLYYMYVLLRDNKDIAAKYQERFQHILVDEFQDTNHAQYLIVRKLAAKHRNICVVGDDAQSIYAFRGANIQNIYNFKTDFPELQLVKLERNYRSCKNIINSANAVIAHNSKQIKKTIYTENEIGEKIALNKSYSDREESQWIAQQIVQAKMKQGAKHSDFVVLYRMNMQSRSLEEAFRQYNIPYKIHSGMSFYQRAEIKDVLAFFRIAVNPKDIEALVRVLGLTSGIGDTTVEKLHLLANENSISMFEVMSNLQVMSLRLNSRAVNRLKALADNIQSWNLRANTTDAYELAADILQLSRIEQRLKEEDTPEADVRLQNIAELMSALKLYTVSEHQVIDEETGEIEISDDEMRLLSEFLQSVALLTSEDEKDETGNKIDRVSMMTIHAAKGLEFPYVFVAGMEENIFPSLKSVASREDLEEERRLFYVAITRAMKNLFLSFSQTRYIHGQFSFNEKSRFLDELDLETLDKPYILKEASCGYEAGNVKKQFPSNGFNFSGRNTFGEKKSFNNSAPVKSNLSNFKSMSSLQSPTLNRSQSITSFVVGQRITHEKFGKGNVAEVTEKDRIVVNFDEVGTKTLLLAFAKLY
ncbi:MAG: UvrD-helicase domain-containing protein [Bacteroidales bacterium]|jgi:DNA helicase-2/ATP-dependent DNA helicase PcrA|nr:UvrD-helicase domain-containing protein [Bacteroidales bacterium]